MLDAQTPAALSKPFHDEGEDPEADELDELDAEDLPPAERRGRRIARADLVRLEVRVRRVAEALAEASASTREAATELRALLAEDGAEVALSKTPGYLSSRVEGLDEAIAALKALFPSVEPAPEPAKKTKR